MVAMTAVVNEYHHVTSVEVHHRDILVPEEATRSVVIDLEIPADGVIDEAVFDLSARPGGRVSLGSAAVVRAGAATGDVVADFGVMTTLSSPLLPVGSGAPSILRWNGVEYVTVESDEFQTERLLMRFGGSVSAAEVGEEGSVILPVSPTGVELVVDGTTVWHERQGTSAGLTPGGSGPGVHAKVDRTDEVRRAFETTGGPVRVELRTTTAGRLELEPAVTVFHVHPVVFEEGAARTVDLPSEGPVRLDLPLPAASPTWVVQAVELTASAQVSDERVLPSEGPATSPDARLRLRPGRPVLARVPDSLVDRTAEVVGVRLALIGRAGGGEVTGRFLLDADGRPGEPVPGGELAPAPVDGTGQPTWTTLRAAGAVTTDARWVEIDLAYGEVEWELTSAPDTDPAAPGAPIHLRRAGGAVRPLTVVETIGPLQGRLRLVGVADPNRPIPVLALAFADDPPSQFEMTPARDGTVARFGPSTGLTPTGATVSLSGAASTAGSYTFTQVLVTYLEEET